MLRIFLSTIFPGGGTDLPEARDLVLFRACAHISLPEIDGYTDPEIFDNKKSKNRFKKNWYLGIAESSRLR